MKLVYTFVLAILIAGFGATSAFADADTSGSSTDTAALQGAGNTGRTPLVEVHSGRPIEPSSKVGSTDAAADAHPLTEVV